MHQRKVAQRRDGLLQRIECVCQHRHVGVHGVGFAPTGDQPGRLLMQRGKNDMRNIGMARKRQAKRDSVGYVARDELRSRVEAGRAAQSPTTDQSGSVVRYSTLARPTTPSAPTTKAFGMEPPLRLPQKTLASKLLLPIPALPGMLVLPLR